jgi:hypothetical protein
VIERMGELDAAARDVGLLILPQLEREIGGDLLSRLVETALAGEDPARND